MALTTDNRYRAQIDDTIADIIEGMHHRRMNAEERYYTYSLEDLVNAALGLTLGVEDQDDVSYEDDMFTLVTNVSANIGHSWASAIIMGTNCVNKLKEQRRGNKMTQDASIVIEATEMCANIVAEYARDRDEKAVTNLMRWALVTIMNDSRIIMLNEGTINPVTIINGGFNISVEHELPDDLTKVITFNDPNWTNGVAAWIDPRNDDEEDLHITNEYFEYRFTDVSDEF